MAYMEPGEEDERVYLLSIPWLKRAPKNAVLATVLLPFVVVAMILILVPRVLMIAVLLIGRMIRVSAYSAATKVPLIVAIFTFIPCIVIFLLVSLVFYSFMVLLQLNLAISGMNGEGTARYVNAIIGPVVGREE